MSKKEITSPTEAKRLIDSARAAPVENVIFPAALIWPKVKGGRFDGVTSERMRLESGLLAKSGLVDCVFTNCDFDGAQWNRATFDRVAFTSTILGKKLHGRWADCRFVDARIEDCELSGIAMEGVSIEGGRISRSNVKKSIIKNSTLKNVAIAAKFFSTNLVACKLENVDFSEATFADSIIGKCQLTNVRWPNREDNFWIDSATLRGAADGLRTRLSAKGFASIQEHMRLFAAGVEGLLLDPTSLVDLNQAEKKSR